MLRTGASKLVHILCRQCPLFAPSGRVSRKYGHETARMSDRQKQMGLVNDQNHEPHQLGPRGYNKGTHFSVVYFGRGTLPQKRNGKRALLGDLVKPHVQSNLTKGTCGKVSSSGKIPPCESRLEVQKVLPHGHARTRTTLKPIDEDLRMSGLPELREAFPI